MGHWDWNIAMELKDLYDYNLKRDMQCCNVYFRIPAYGFLRCLSIRDFPDHATFREKGAKLACADKLRIFLSLTLCNKANFDPLQPVKYDGPENM